jgi:hypothetical protein
MTTPGQIARRAFYEAMKGSAPSETLWEAAAGAVVEICAKVADVYGETVPVEGEAAPLIATVMSDTGKKVAEGIRKLKVGE